MFRGEQQAAVFPCNLSRVAEAKSNDAATASVQRHTTERLTTRAKIGLRRRKIAHPQAAMPVNNLRQLCWSGTSVPP
jgi:hypothetical protein